MRRRLPTDRERSLFNVYQSEIARRYCPLLAASHRRKLAFSVFFELTRVDRTKVASEIIRHVLRVVGDFLHVRAKLDPADQKMLCFNVVLLTIECWKSDEWKAVLDACHWELKRDFTKHLLMFGKFWPGEQHISLSGSPVPDAPFPFLSIRSFIAGRDEQFFLKSRILLDTLKDPQNLTSNTPSVFIV